MIHLQQTRFSKKISLSIVRIQKLVIVLSNTRAFEKFLCFGFFLLISTEYLITVIKKSR